MRRLRLAATRHDRSLRWIVGACSLAVWFPVLLAVIPMVALAGIFAIPNAVVFGIGVIASFRVLRGHRRRSLQVLVVWDALGLLVLVAMSRSADSAPETAGAWLALSCAAALLTATLVATALYALRSRQVKV